MPYAEIGEFMEKQRLNGSVSAAALEFTVLTAVRTGETIGAGWAEIDLESAVSTIPGKRMKAGREQRAPPSRRAAEIVRERISRVIYQACWA